MLNEKQLKNRSLGIGGADCAAILGASPFSTPRQVYFEKVLGVKKEANGRMLLGAMLEPFVLSRANEIFSTDFKVIEDTLYHPKHQCLLGNLDAISNNEILEIKTSACLQKWNELPKEVELQTRHYLSLTSLEKATIIAVCAPETILKTLHLKLTDGEKNAWDFFKTGGGFVKKFEIYRDEKIEKVINRKCVEFWENHVLKQIPPEAIGKEDYSSVEVKKGTKRTITNEQLRILEEKKAKIEKTKRTLEGFSKDYERELVNLMCDAQFLIRESGELVASTHTRTTETIDKKKLKELAPDIFEKCIKTTTSNVLKMA